MADQESERIARRFTRIAQPREAMVQAVFDVENNKWLVRAITMHDDDDFKKAVRGRFAEGGSLKEALMNLADKIDV